MLIAAVVLPILDRRLAQAWQKVGFDPQLIEAAEKLPRLHFGNWIGGVLADRQASQRSAGLVLLAASVSAWAGSRTTT